MPFFYHLGLVGEFCQRAALGRFGPGSHREYVVVGADKGKPALSRRAGARSSRHERKRLGVGEPVTFHGG